MNKPLLTSTWLIALCLVFLSFLSSCQKADEPAPPPVITCLPSKTYNEADPTQYTTYQYDSQRRVTRITDVIKGKESRALLYEYNALGQVGKITIKDQSLNEPQAFPDKVYVIITLEYNTLGQVSKYFAKYPWRDDPSAFQKTTCEYDPEGNRAKTITTYDDDVASSHTSVYTYEDGNCIKRVYYSDTSTVNTSLYQYNLSKENKLLRFNQAFDLMSLIGPSASKNMTAATSETASQYHISVKQTYEYNKDGLPTKLHRLWDISNSNNTTVTIDVMEYVCQ